MWYTDDQLAAIPALAGADPAQIPVISDAAARIYGYLGAHAGVSDADLRVWAEAAGIDPECFNAAVGFLQQAGKAAQVSAGAGGLGAAATDGVSATISGVLTAAFTAKDLTAAAKRVGAEVASSASKEEQAAAIAEAVLSA